MFSNLSEETPDSVIHYPATDSSLPFAEYIQQCQQMIESRRRDIHLQPENAEKILHANSPFELQPAPATNNGAAVKAGALLIHGLLDCPFTYREISTHLQQVGLLTRAILLPGHGTRPSDLLQVTYHDWLQAVRYGIESLKNEVEQIFLVGYSTGAALSVYHALQDSRITGIILISPAIKLRTEVDIAANCLHLANYLGKERNWVVQTEEDDYAKYRSVTFNSVKQVIKLSDAIREMSREHPLKQPMLMLLSREDETISSREAIDFFTTMSNPTSKMLLYSADEKNYSDTRIEVRNANYPALNIAHFSHVSLPFSAKNCHYGQNGDFIGASIPKHDKFIDGAYNRFETNAFDVMVKYNIAEHTRRVLTYNPDFNDMINKITKFIADTIKNC